MRFAVEGFARRLALLAVAALAIRLAYALGVMHGIGVGGDGQEFHELANGIAADGRYRAPLLPGGAGGQVTADKPPLYPLYLAGPSLAGLTSVAAHRAASCLLGTLTVVAAGLLGRRVAGERAGLVAAGLAGLYPMLVVLDGALRSEALYAPLVAFSLLAAYRLVDRPGAGRAAFLGALLGLATLTRSEALLLLPLLVAPTLWLVPRGARLRLAAVTAAACLLVIAPWLVRNQAVFGAPLLSTNFGSLVYGANCDAAYGGELIGGWPCFPPRLPGARDDERAFASRLRTRGVDYARDHTGRLPAVVAVRILRSAELWDPWDQAALEHGIADRDLTAERAGLLAYYPLAALAVYGALVLRRRVQPLRILLAPFALVLVVSALAYGSTRFRAPAEAPLTVLAAVALVELLPRARLA